jgi:hypothetical protein
MMPRENIFVLELVNQCDGTTLICEFLAYKVCPVNILTPNKYRIEIFIKCC